MFLSDWTFLWLGVDWGGGFQMCSQAVPPACVSREPACPALVCVVLLLVAGHPCVGRSHSMASFERWVLEVGRLAAIPALLLAVCVAGAERLSDCLGISIAPCPCPSLVVSQNKWR